jgi:hypothetical protein
LFEQGAALKLAHPQQPAYDIGAASSLNGGGFKKLRKSDPQVRHSSMPRVVSPGLQLAGHQVDRDDRVIAIDQGGTTITGYGCRSHGSFLVPYKCRLYNRKELRSLGMAHLDLGGGHAHY